MSKLQVDDIVNNDNTGSVGFSRGVVVTGVTTSTSFVGSLTGNAGSATVLATSRNIGGVAFDGSGDINLPGVNQPGTQNTSGTAGSTGVLSAGATGVDLTLSGDLTVNGTTTTIDSATLSVEDKNIGIGSVTTPTNTTADGGGFTLFAGADGDKTLTWNDSTPDYWQLVGGGLRTPGLELSGYLKEGVRISADKLSVDTQISIADGMIHYRTTQETTTSTPNIRYSSTVSLNTVMDIGDAITVTIITTAAAAGYSAQLTIDGSSVTENWVGGSAPSAGGANGVDLYSYNIIKTANATFTVIASLTSTAS
jgi:hypothetical protein